MVGVACVLGPILFERVHPATPRHCVHREETGYLGVLGASEKVEVWCKLESVAGVMKDFGVKRHFFVGVEVRRVGWGKDSDTGFLLLSLRCFVGGRGLVEESLAFFRGEVSHSLV